MTSTKDPLSILGLPEDIEQEARRISKKLGDLLVGTRRTRNARNELFFSVYHSYRALRRVCSDHELGQKIGINNASKKKGACNMNKKIKDILKSYYRLGYPPPLVEYLPEDYLVLCCAATGISTGEIPEISKLIKRTAEQYPKVAQELPGVVAAGATIYYASTVAASGAVDIELVCRTTGIGLKKGSAINEMRIIFERSDNS